MISSSTGTASSPHNARMARPCHGRLGTPSGSTRSSSTPRRAGRYPPDRHRERRPVRLSNRAAEQVHHGDQQAEAPEAGQRVQADPCRGRDSVGPVSHGLPTSARTRHGGIVRDHRRSVQRASTVPNPRLPSRGPCGPTPFRAAPWLPSIVAHIRGALGYIAFSAAQAVDPLRLPELWSPRAALSALLLVGGVVATRTSPALGWARAGWRSASRSGRRRERDHHVEGDRQPPGGHRHTYDRRHLYDAVPAGTSGRQRSQRTIVDV